MYTVETLREWFERRRSQVLECRPHEEHISTEEMITQMFGIVTYSGSADEHFARLIIGVLVAIVDKKTFAYIGESYENENAYLHVCNFAVIKGMLSWGTSIRGAWFEAPEGGWRPGDYLDGGPVEGEPIIKTQEEFKSLVYMLRDALNEGEDKANDPIELGTISEAAKNMNSFLGGGTASRSSMFIANPTAEALEGVEGKPNLLAHFRFCSLSGDNVILHDCASEEISKNWAIALGANLGSSIFPLIQSHSQHPSDIHIYDADEDIAVGWFRLHEIFIADYGSDVLRTDGSSVGYTWSRYLQGHDRDTKGHEKFLKFFMDYKERYNAGYVFFNITAAPKGN